MPIGKLARLCYLLIDLRVMTIYSLVNFLDSEILARTQLLVRFSSPLATRLHYLLVQILLNLDLGIELKPAPRIA